MKSQIYDWQAIYQARIDSLNYQVDTAQLAIIKEFSRLEKELNKCLEQ